MKGIIVYMIQIAQLFEVSTSPKVATLRYGTGVPSSDFLALSEDLMATETY